MEVKDYVSSLQSSTRIALIINDDSGERNYEVTSFTCIVLILCRMNKKPEKLSFTRNYTDFTAVAQKVEQNG
jgi:hypothetical protein